MEFEKGSIAATESGLIVLLVSGVFQSDLDQEGRSWFHQRAVVLRGAGGKSAGSLLDVDANKLKAAKLSGIDLQIDHAVDILQRQGATFLPYEPELSETDKLQRQVAALSAQLAAKS